MSESVETKPWPREKLDTHVKQQLRKHLDAVVGIEQDDDDMRHACLPANGEDAVWRVVLQAIEDAGWQICSGDPVPAL